MGQAGRTSGPFRLWYSVIVRAISDEYRDSVGGPETGTHASCDIYNDKCNTPSGSLNWAQIDDLWIRGPWVTREYFKRPSTNEAYFKYGWLKTETSLPSTRPATPRLLTRQKSD